MNQIDLTDRVAVVTGGAQGIGYAVADRLVRSGAAVCLWDRDEQQLPEARETLAGARPGARVEAVIVDQTEWTQVARATEETVSRLGRIDILVNNAGVAGLIAPLVDYPVEEWTRIIDINLTGAFHCCKAVIPHMIAAGYGRVVNVASVAGKEGNPNAAAYSASKAAVMALTKSLGKELAGQNISVNCVTPSPVKTRLFDQITEQHIQYMLSRIPRARFLEADEAASMIAWLVSEENSYTTGAVFDLSGGRTTY